MWISYILTGAGANLVSWLVLPRASVSVGASGAVFGLFAISVLVKVFFSCVKFLRQAVKVHYQQCVRLIPDVVGLEEDT